MTLVGMHVLIANHTSHFLYEETSEWEIEGDQRVALSYLGKKEYCLSQYA